MVAVEVEWFSPSLPITLPISLSRQEVHIWRVDLDQPSDRLMMFSTLLSSDEHERANRFYFEHDRRRFIVSRGGLRTILSFYLNCLPCELQLQYGNHGKPELSDRPSHPIQFNVSHSHELAVYVVAYDRRVGIDLEYIRSLEKRDRLAHRFFSIRETEMLHALSESDKTTMFFRYWTCKEAYVKAIGVGLSLSTSTIEILLGARESTLLSVAGNSQEAKQWTLQQFVPAPNYVAALAIEGHDGQLMYWNVGVA